jgi:hypothetical protein
MASIALAREQALQFYDGNVENNLRAIPYYENVCKFNKLIENNQG